MPFTKVLWHFTIYSNILSNLSICYCQPSCLLQFYILLGNGKWRQITILIAIRCWHCGDNLFRENTVVVQRLHLDLSLYMKLFNGLPTLVHESALNAHSLWFNAHSSLHMELRANAHSICIQPKHLQRCFDLVWPFELISQVRTWPQTQAHHTLPQQAGKKLCLNKGILRIAKNHKWMPFFYQPTQQ